MIWIVLAAMTAVAVVIALWPVVSGRRRTGDSPSEVVFYKSQLAEIDRDVERGQLLPSEAAAARAETARRLIAADAVEARPAVGGGRRRLVAAVLGALVVPVVAIGLYFQFGSPNLPDAPLASRTPDSNVQDDIEAAVAHVEAEAAASPDNLKAWSALAPVYMRLGRYSDGVNAWKQVLRIGGEDGEARAALGEAQVAAAGGLVTAEARASIDRALVDSPGLPMARFYLGLAAEQEGDKQKAIDIYQSVLGQVADHPYWQEVVQAKLAALKGEPAPAPQASASNEASAPPAGVDGSAGAGAPAGGPQDMIRGMVARLANRLAQKGGSAEEWTRLVRSYSVLNEPDKAKEALAAARKALAGDPSALASLDGAAKDAPADSGAASAATPAPEGGQQEMIRGMVARLADRLSQTGGSAEDWTRLVRSYSVLNEPDKAKEALASARKALAGDASGSASLESLAKQLNVGSQ
jgi:cytochrome c-type biogenesis protein CcmI